MGVTHEGGEQFDASWDRGDPLEFRLGVGMVIQGWDEGIAGMKVGGRRRLTIPAHKAYGDRGAGGVIKPGATLRLRGGPHGREVGEQRRRAEWVPVAVPR